jgi:mitogen-activated protein kinase kinase
MMQQDKDNFLQAAKRTPVNLQEWAVSMMERHNRKSYLAPPAPKALKRDGSRDSVVPFSASSTSTSSIDTRSTNSSHNATTPTSGEIPILASQDAPYYQPPLPPSVPIIQVPTGIAERSPPPPLSLQHLSLETQDAPNGPVSRTNRLGFANRIDMSSLNRDNIPEPMSAIEPSSRPMFPPRTSSNSGLQSGRLGQAFQNGGLPMRPPPPTGPLPLPPGGREPVTLGLVSPRRQR